MGNFVQWFVQSLAYSMITAGLVGWLLMLVRWAIWLERREATERYDRDDFEEEWMYCEEDDERW